jgi:hypothetical protein
MGTMIHLQARIDDVNCVETVRNRRWPAGVQCPTCDRAEVTQHGRDETQPERPRARWKSGARRVDELTETIFAGHQHPRRVWSVCLDGMGRNRSHHHRAQELDRTASAVQQMRCQWRQGVVAQPSPATVSGEGEGAEV